MILVVAYQVFFDAVKTSDIVKFRLRAQKLVDFFLLRHPKHPEDRAVFIQLLAARDRAATG